MVRAVVALGLTCACSTSSTPRATDAKGSDAEDTGPTGDEEPTCWGLEPAALMDCAPGGPRPCILWRSTTVLSGQPGNMQPAVTELGSFVVTRLVAVPNRETFEGWSIFVSRHDGGHLRSDSFASNTGPSSPTLWGDCVVAKGGDYGVTVSCFEKYSHLAEDTVLKDGSGAFVVLSHDRMAYSCSSDTCMTTQPDHAHEKVFPGLVLRSGGYGGALAGVCVTENAVCMRDGVTGALKWATPDTSLPSWITLSEIVPASGRWTYLLGGFGAPVDKTIRFVAVDDTGAVVFDHDLGVVPGITQWVVAGPIHAGGDDVTVGVWQTVTRIRIGTGPQWARDLGERIDSELLMDDQLTTYVLTQPPQPAPPTCAGRRLWALGPDGETRWTAGVPSRGFRGELGMDREGRLLVNGPDWLMLLDTDATGLAPTEWPKRFGGYGNENRPFTEPAIPSWM